MFWTCSLISSISVFISITIFVISIDADFEPIVLVSLFISWIKKSEKKFYIRRICSTGNQSANWSGGIRHLAGCFRLRQDDHSSHHRRTWAAGQRKCMAGGERCDESGAKPERCEHGISELCPFSPYERGG